MPFAWTLYKMNKAKARSIRIAAWDHAMSLLQGIAAFASQTPTEDQLKLQERLQTLCDMRVPADAVIEVAELILLARKIGKDEEANALSAGDRVDAERFRHIFGTLQYFQARAWLSGFDVFDDTSYIMSKEQAQQMMLNKIDAAILQSQKGGSHG